GDRAPRRIARGRSAAARRRHRRNGRRLAGRRIRAGDVDLRARLRRRRRPRAGNATPLTFLVGPLVVFAASRECPLLPAAARRDASPNLWYDTRRWRRL